MRLAVFAAFGAWFWLIYLGCDYLAASFAHRYDVRTPLDNWPPFLPQTAIAYMLINPLLAAPAVILQDWPRIAGFYATLCAEVALAGVLFLAFPVMPPQAIASDDPAMRVADFVNLTYNTFPSLHVTLATSCGMVLSPILPRGWKSALWIAILAIVASTLLTKQHYVADVVGGATLAAVSMRVLFPKLAGRFRIG